MRTLFLTLLLLFSLCTCGLAQDITITADIALADDQCNPVINDPNTDCIGVPAGNDMLTYLPGQDGDIIVTYRLTNNSGGTITQVLVTDSDRGTIVPVTGVNILPGTTVVTSRIYPAETTSRTVTATVTANVANAAGASLSIEGEYTLDVVAPMVAVEFGVARQADLCDEEPVAPNCPIPYGAENGQTVTVGAMDTFTTRFAWENTGQNNYDFIDIVDQDDFEVTNTEFDQEPGQTLISSRHWVAPAMPGTYNYSLTLTITDQGGNMVSKTVTYIVIVEAPKVAVEFGVARQADLCDEEPVAPNCPVPYGPLNGQAITVGAKDTFTTRFAWTNTGLGEYDLINIVDQDDFEVTNSEFDQEPGQTLVSSRHWKAPDAPGTYNFSLLLTITDQGGNVVTATVTYIVIVEAPKVAVEFGVARQADLCDEEPVAPNCPVPYGAENGQIVTVGARDTFTTRYAWTNTGLGEYDLINIVDQDNFEVTNTEYDQEPGQTLISSRHWVAPAMPGTYNYSLLLTITDQGGNVVTATVTYIVIVEAPKVAVEFGVARQADLCDNEPVAPNCPVPYGPLNGQAITVGANDTFTTRFAWTNTGLGEYDLINIVDQDDFEVTNTEYDQEPGQTLISSRHWVSPDAPGTYSYSLLLTITDQGGNVVTATVTYLVKVNCGLGDQAPPTALCRNRSFTILEGETQNINAGMIDDNSFDGCGALAGGGIDITSFTCADEGPNTVTLTVGDLSGNAASCTATVTINVTDAVYEGPNDDCVSTIAAVAGGQAWHDITTANGQLIGQVIIGNNTNIARVKVGIYKSASMTESVGGNPLLSKRIDLRMLDAADNTVQPNNEQIYVRLYYSAAEIAALSAASPGANTSTFSLVKTSNSDCGSGYTGQDATPMITTFNSFGCSGEDGYFEFFTGSFSTFYLFATEASLPVEMTEFTAREVEKQRVQLNWITATETDNSHFEVEHSTDGRTFSFLGEVAGAGNAFEEQGYDFLHLNPAAGENFYRLRQVDLDGTETLSEVRVVDVSAALSLSVYPNPTAAQLRIKGFAGGSVQVLDAQGRMVLERELSAHAALNVSALPAGAYLLRAGGDVVRWVKR